MDVDALVENCVGVRGGVVVRDDGKRRKRSLLDVVSLHIQAHQLRIER